jgi:periplasmic protein TonB
MSAVNEGALQQNRLGSVQRSNRPAVVSSPAALRKQGVFATAIIEEDARARGKRAAQTGLALALQVAVVGMLLLIPLLFTEGIDLYKYNATLLVAPPPPAPPPPVARVQAVAPKSFIKAELTAPTVIPKKIVATADAAPAAPALAGMQGGVPGGMGDILGGTSVAAPPPPPPAAVEKPKGPIRITTGMREPRVLYAPPAVYSPIARQAHISGAVIIEAIIDEQGNVTQVRAVSGPPLLIDSAMKAVSGRKYEVTYLDGQPVAIRLNVIVNFRMS